MGVHSLNLEQSCDYIWQLLLRGLQGHFSYFMPVGPPGFDLIAALHLVLCAAAATAVGVCYS